MDARVSDPRRHFASGPSESSDKCVDEVLRS